ncbi:hypothetical protein HS141_16170 [Cetobacterium somerae]|uniref:hypothetical protein n=1 Tax=Cetobacterium somerae TaxID=188913 RepID=UPI00211DF77E|nr:hypothetical protein [Cetobacterium somerae]MCQ9628455.1 hypothetical protein [Cetobacterium somerae]
MSLILTLFFLTFSNIFSSNTSKENMNINAIVLKPLKVIHNGDINYGKVIQGSIHSTNGHTFIIYGEPGQNVDISLNDKNLNGFKENIWECTKFSVNSLLSYQILNVQISYLRLGTLKVLIA